LQEGLSELTSLERKLLALKNTSYTVGTTRIWPYKNMLPIPKFKIEVSVFSDTVVLALYGDDELSRVFPDSFLIYMTGFFLIPIFRKSFVNEMYLRGTLSVGEFHLYKGKLGLSLVGPAVNDAAQSYESTSWIGISTSQSASLTLEQERKGSSFERDAVAITTSYKGLKANLQAILDLIKSSFIRYDIPRKDGTERKGWALAWPTFFDKGAYYTRRDQVNRVFEKELSYKKYQESPIGYDIYNKFKNTRFFYDYCRAYRELDCTPLSRFKI
jgi:hypothetical protein